MTEKELAIKNRDDRAWMENPEWWSIQHPVRMCPIKHRTITTNGHQHGLPRTGRLMRFSDGSFLVFQWKDENPTEMEPMPLPYTTVDDVLAAGWIVD